MENLLNKIEKFKASNPRVGSAHMFELLEEIRLEFNKLKAVDLTQNRWAKIRTLHSIQCILKNLDNGDLDKIGRSVTLYGLFSLVNPPEVPMDHPHDPPTQNVTNSDCE